jgi:hypothetical protein
VPEGDGATDWRRLREFAAVDLSRSFLLSWAVELDTLLLDTDLFLEPAHPFYERPRPNEKVCIRPATIEFPFCESVEAEGVPADAELADKAGRLGHGAIAGFRRLSDGRYEISGEFGAVLIRAERPILKLKGP